MSQFSAIEILKMAEKAENNAARFYRKAAEAQKSLPVRDSLIKMAHMEEEHGTAFAALVEKAGGAKALQDPYGDLQLYLNAVVDMHRGEGSLDAEHVLTGKETLQQVVSMALGAESRSILFYEGVHDMLADDLTKHTVARIIREEKSHMAALQALLK